MRLDLIRNLRGNPLLYHYLKYHSYWYKELNRDPNSLKELEQEMKKAYKLTPEDRISKINDKISFIVSFLDVLK